MFDLKKKKDNEGRNAELAVVSIINYWISQKKVFKCKRMIVKCFHADAGDRLDKEGIDVLLVFDSGLAMPVQIKRSFPPKKKGRHNINHPHIKFFFGTGNLPQEEFDGNYNRIARNLENLINGALLRHHHQ